MKKYTIESVRKNVDGSVKFSLNNVQGFSISINSSLRGVKDRNKLETLKEGNTLLIEGNEIKGHDNLNPSSFGFNRLNRVYLQEGETNEYNLLYSKPFLEGKCPTFWQCFG